MPSPISDIVGKQYDIEAGESYKDAEVSVGLTKRFPLAVITKTIGVYSETFIRRHVQDLLPSKVVNVTWCRVNNSGWDTSCPTLIRGSYAEHVRRRNLFRRTEPIRSALGLRGSDFGTWQWKVRDFLSKHEVKVALGEYLDVSHSYIGTMRSLGIRFFAHAHGYDVSTVLSKRIWRQRYLDLNSCDGIVTMSEYSKDRLVDIGITKELITVIPYGVDVPEDYPKSSGGAGTVRCLAVGRMTAKKAPLLLLTAFHKALTAYPDMTLDYCGDGELMAQVKQFVQEHKMEGSVNLRGQTTNELVMRLMSEASMFLQHSVVDPDSGDEEGLPVAILEAMASGLAIVATKHAGIPEQVVDGENGYLVDEYDTDAMADRIAALAKDHEIRRRMGRAGWSRALEKFTWAEERRKLCALLGVGEM